MEEVWDGSLEEGCWTPRFIRAFNGWEFEEVERLLLKLQGRRIHNTDECGVGTLWSYHGRSFKRCKKHPSTKAS